MTEPKPDDLDAAYAEIRKAPYVFTWDGRTWTLPHMGELDYRLLMRIEKHESLDADEVAALFADLFTGEQREAWAGTLVPLPLLMMLFDRYVKHSGGTLGEDSASSDSSGSTGKSSRRTSGATTTSGSRSRSSAKKAAPAKRAPRKAAKATTVLTSGDQEWIAKHQALAGSPPAN